MRLQDEIKTTTIEIRKNMRVDFENWAMLQFDCGMEFLEFWYSEKEALAIATKTNFWSLWLLEWGKDDLYLYKHHFALVSTYAKYVQTKKFHVCDLTLLRTINNYLEWH